MTTAQGRGVRLEVALTYGTAKTVTAVTKASPGVATSTVHGLANGVVGYWNVTDGGMPQLNQQATRVYNQATNTFELQGLNTAGYSDFTAGTFVPAATWGTLSEAIGYKIGGGSASDQDDTKLLDVVTQLLPGTLAADTVSIDLLSQTYNSVVMQKIEDASIAGTYLLFRVTLQDGATRVFYGTPGRPGEDLSRGSLATGSFQVKTKGLVLKGQA